MEDWFILEFAHSGCLCTELAGGKARNLSSLASLGLSVPPGYCITTSAYRAFVEANALRPVIDSAQASVDPSAVSSTEAASERIRQAFLTAEIPRKLADEIEIAYQRLGPACRVAVRSSATAEDLAYASFAGTHATILNVRGISGLLDAVRECWASLWSPRVIAYRRQRGISEDGVALAVVVQRMVNAVVAGVMFTVEPATGNRDLFAIEACWGLGEPLVSGRITGEHYLVERSTLHIREYRPGSQDEVVASDDGTGFRRVPALPSRRCLEQQHLRDLAEIGIQIEAHCGAPQDIEWAIGPSLHGEEQIFILQSRSVTTLRQPTDVPLLHWESPVPGGRFVRRSGGIVEYLSGVPSPLYATAQLPEICRLQDRQCPEMGGRAPVPGSALINGYFYSRSDYPLTPTLLLLPYRYWKAARRAARWWADEALPAQQKRLSALLHFDPGAASSTDLLEHLYELFQFNALAWDTAIRGSRTYVFTEPLFCRIFNSFIRPVTGGNPITFLRGFESQVTAAEHAHWALVRTALLSPDIGDTIRRRPNGEALALLSSMPASRRWHQDFQEYCKRYGHVSATHDYMNASAGDDPGKALDTIRTRMELPSGDPVKMQREVAIARQKATVDAYARLTPYPIRLRLFRWALEWAQQGAATREDIFFHAFEGWPLARRAILEAGSRLTEQGAIQEPEDIFFLHWNEMQELMRSSPRDMYETVAGRRREHEFLSAITPPPSVPVGEATRTLRRRLVQRLKQFLVGSSAESHDGILRGAPTSPGIVSGPARVVKSVAEFGRLQNGDILVARAATAEWTPTFAVVAGLITDVGGPLSHSSIIAREFGIPAVMGVHNATLSISEGQLVTIDGNEGLVRLR